MKTTVDIPDELLREIEVRAARNDRKLEDMMAGLLRRGLAAEDAGVRQMRRRVELPLVCCAHEARPDARMTPERVADVLLEEESGSR